MLSHNCSSPCVCVAQSTMQQPKAIGRELQSLHEFLKGHRQKPSGGPQQQLSITFLPPHPPFLPQTRTFLFSPSILNIILIQIFKNNYNIFKNRVTSHFWTTFKLFFLHLSSSSWPSPWKPAGKLPLLSSNSCCPKTYFGRIGM